MSVEEGTPVNTFREVWNKLEKSKKYREAFAFSVFKRMVPFQIRALRRQRKWSQSELAENASLTQGVISRAEDPDYGKLTINTISRIAAGFDIAFLVKFVPFSELDKWFLDLSEKSVEVQNFETENQSFVNGLPLDVQAMHEDQVVACLVNPSYLQGGVNIIGFTKGKVEMNSEILSGGKQALSTPTGALFGVIGARPETRISACS